MEESVVNKALLSLTAVQELGEKLRSDLETQRELANKVEAMKEIGVSFSRVLEDLSRLRESSIRDVDKLLEDQQRLEKKIQETQARQNTSMKQKMQCFLEQMKLFSLESEEDFTELCSSSRALNVPLQNIQENISSGCASAEQQVSVQADLLSSTSSSLASSLRQNIDNGLDSVNELKETGAYAHAALSGFVERDVLWASKNRKHSETTVQERISLMGSISTDAQSSQQIVSQLCSGLGSSTAQQLSAQARQLNQSLRSLRARRSEESGVLQEDQAQLQQRVEKTRSLVKSFLREELQRDVSTGATPQRREFEFPRQLVKGRSRAELLECLRNQQEALRAALEEEEEEGEEEEEEHSQDSLEDEPSTSNESLATEPSFIDENLVFNESRRLPFFKKKGKRKQTKIPSRPKAAEMESTPKKSSRLPLRCQN